MRQKRLLIFFLPFIFMACNFGSAEFTSNIKGFSFKPDCTVFAYTDKEKLPENGTDAAKNQLHIHMTWICFDPTRSLGENEERANIIKEFRKRDALSIVVNLPDNKGETSIETGKYKKEDVKITIYKNILNNKALEIDLVKLQEETEFEITDVTANQIKGRIKINPGALVISGNFSAYFIKNEADVKIAKENLGMLVPAY